VRASRLVLAFCFVLACNTRGGSRASGAGDGTLPGAESYSPELIAELERAVAGQGAGYVPRTRHRRADGSAQYTNRLILQSSPYLLQHAHNPVNWYPWGDEAFDAARRLGRPVFLSVGYSTCHWCHVMEEESFEDEEIAAYLNANYVAIKVDREERPDVDAIYMSAVQSMTGSGGWPMSVWLTPDRKPFYAGTYFPPRDSERGTGYLTVLRELATAYRADPAKVAKVSAQIAARVQSNLSGARAGDLPGAALLHAALEVYRAQFDSVNGGLQRRKKFPSALPVRLLLRYHRRTGDAPSLQMAELTLDKMAAGGMYDHVGGGFHRYTVDRQWQVPHFEKMLYDNALLVVAYLEGYQVLRKPRYAEVAREVLDYVTREMASPHGGFYSATDADSPTPAGKREEGYFFTWTAPEITRVLGAKRAHFVKTYYGVSDGGNFEGRNILHTDAPLAQVARELGLPLADARARLASAREQLYAKRARRPPPLLDDKILTAWNGLMISAFARGAQVLGEPRYADRAKKAARFVLEHMRVDGRLLRSYRAGRARLSAYLQDYAFFIAGLLDLYEATGELRWLDDAIALTAVVREHYEDRQGGGFFTTSHDHEVLLARQKPSYDGAIPTGNSVMALNLLRLYEFTERAGYRAGADATLRAFAGDLAKQPTALGQMLLALDYRLDLPKEIVIVTAGGRADADALLRALAASYVPNQILAVVTTAPGAPRVVDRVPLVENKIARDGKATAYVCERGACELPTSDPGVFGKQLAKVRPLAAK